MRHLAIAAVAAGMIAAAPAAQAQIVFQEDFFTSTPGIYGSGITIGQFSVTSGIGPTVDVVGVLNGSYLTCVGNPGGNCVDLIGNAGPGAEFTSLPFGLTVGHTYQLEFDYVSQDSSAPNFNQQSSFTATVGGVSFPFLTDGVVQTAMPTFTALGTTSNLVFAVQDGDQVHGPVISNITITDVTQAVAVPSPVPGTGLAALLGLGGAWYVRRRRVVAA